MKFFWMLKWKCKPDCKKVLSIYIPNKNFVAIVILKFWKLISEGQVSHGENTLFHKFT